MASSARRTLKGQMSTNKPTIDEAIETEMKKLQERLAPGEVVAMLDQETGSPGEDGCRWRFFVTDGERAVRVEAALSASQEVIFGGEVTHHLLEAAVERRVVNNYPVESRMDDLASTGPFQLRAEDLRPRPEPSVFT
jgi:hypothetical protein